MATRTLAEAESALKSGGLTGKSLADAINVLRGSYSGSAVPPPPATSGGRNLDFSSTNPASSLAQTGAASSDVAQSSDPYTVFNQQLMSMLARKQSLGTRRFQEQGFNAQQEQNNRVLKKTDPSLIGASPNLQDSVRSGQSSALNPTIDQARNAQQTFGEQVNSFGEALNSAHTLLNDYQAQQDKERDDARNLVKDALTTFGSKGFDIIDKKYLKLAGYDDKTIGLAKDTLKEQELALKSAGSGSPTPTGTPTDQQATVINDIENVIADPNFDSTFGIANIVNRHNPTNSAYNTAQNVSNIINKISLAARGQLKGQGQVSNYEGELLRKAQTALTMNMEPAAAKYELKQVEGAIRTSSGLTAQVKITNPDGTVQVGPANQATITQAITDGNRVEYI